jgi:hypothetical protein
MENPYQSIVPVNEKSAVFQVDQSQEKLAATSAAQAYLYSMKGWVRFISVLGFISFAVMVFYMFVMMVFVGAFTRGVGGSFGGLLFLLMLVMAAVVFMLALRLSKYSNSIGRMQISRNRGDLENAMIEQMKFWRLTGVLVIILLAFILLGFLSSI